MKYGTWKIAAPREEAVQCLCAAGYAPLTAYVLSSRGICTPERAQALLGTQQPLDNPLCLREMQAAVDAVRAALQRGERIAVFGDYDVDGITATCLLTDYLRSLGADCIFHIPGRIEEGYGLNIAAITELETKNVRLIITVDCGITALEEAEYCARRGITLIVTDHHECKSELPRAAAVIDPHRCDSTYPHTNLSGVGVAFKLAAALDGNQEKIAQRYCDLYALGTVADVMPLCGENRRLVMQGLAAMQVPERLGLRALIHACACDERPITAATIGYVLAPRINAAGRMEHAELAVQLFLADDERQAEKLAQTLCRLNRERQTTEVGIYHEAVALLRKTDMDDRAIVLAGENWHQGVIGIVASRLCEEFCRPTFLICLNGERGKASSRSYGGFNLFAALRELSPLLEGYGGHEFAAGFTILRKNVGEFRRCVCQLVADDAAGGQGSAALEIDCEIPANLLTLEAVEALSQLEPCGTGCPKPVLCICEATVEQAGTVGNGKHLRLRLHAADGTVLQAICFSGGALAEKLRPGRRVDVAFQPQINEFRGMRTVQLNVLDLRLASATSLYERYLEGGQLSPFELESLTPGREDLAAIWRYLCIAAPNGGQITMTQQALSEAVAARFDYHSVRRTAVCLDILAELKLIALRRDGETLTVSILPDSSPNPMENSRIYCELRGELHGVLSGAV